MMSLLSRPANASLPAQAFWNKFKPRPKEEPPKQEQMAVARPRLLTLAFGEVETLRILPNSFAELHAAAHEWLKPPPDVMINLRIPVEYASIQAARLVSGPYIYLTGEDSYQIAIMNVQGVRVEIVGDAPPPIDEPPPPPPPPVLEMPGTFNLELQPGQIVALDVTINSDELDMARMEDGTVVAGSFWGKLDIVHEGDNHSLDFTGTKMIPTDDISPDMLVDARLLSKLGRASRPPVAKFNLSILTNKASYCDVILTFSPAWKLGVAWPPPEELEPHKVKYFLRAHPGGALEHFESQVVSTALYYEAIPEAAMIDPMAFVNPRNAFALTFRDFIPHLGLVLDQLGLSLHAKTGFINNNLAAFSAHKNIAYRFLSPGRIAAAVDITVTAEPCVFTRLFLIFRGVSDDEMGQFGNAGEKEANQHNWRETVGWSETAKDPEMFRVLETAILDIS